MLYDKWMQEHDQVWAMINKVKVPETKGEVTPMAFRRVAVGGTTESLRRYASL